MPKRRVEIEWDEPNDEHWLNVFTIEFVLRHVCKNTRFKVKDLDTGMISDDSWVYRSKKGGH